MWRLIRWLLLLLVVGGVLGGGGYSGYEAWKKASQPKFVTADVTRGRVEAVVNSTGTVKAVKTVTVGSFVSGPITRVLVDYNTIVKSEELMAEIDPRLINAGVERDKATLKTQQAELRRVEAQLKQAIRNEERGVKLMKINKDYLSETEWDQLRFARMSLEAQKGLAEAAIEQAQASLDNSNTNLSYTKVKAPLLKDGETAIVVEKKVDEGQTVASQFQTPEMFILAINLDKEVHVFASVDEADIGQIIAAQKANRPVSFTVDAYPQDMFEGKIYQVRKNSTTTQNVVTYPVVIEAKNPDLKLMPGMTASISFLIEEKPTALRLPSSALRFFPQVRQIRPEDRHYLDGTPNPNGSAQPSQPGGTGSTDSGVRLSASQKAELAAARTKRIVWVKDAATPLLRAVPVTLGLADNKFSELLSGDLKEGDQVVTGTEVVVPGAR